LFLISQVLWIKEVAGRIGHAMSSFIPTGSGPVGRA
jgi:hypothetical protein